MSALTFGSFGPSAVVLPKNMESASMLPFRAPHIQPDLPAPMDIPDVIAMTESGTSA